MISESLRTNTRLTTLNLHSDEIEVNEKKQKIEKANIKKKKKNVNERI